MIEQSGEPGVLLSRMRSGDRAAAAEFIERFGPRIRRRIKGKLGATMRRLFDSQEIMSTLGRRLDEFVRLGRLRASCEAELWGLVHRIADNALVEKARIVRALEGCEGEDGPLARAFLNRLHDSARVQESEIEIDEVLRSLEDPTDREILSLWLMGNDHPRIGACVGLAPTAVRKRWQKIREHLRARCELGV